MVDALIDAPAPLTVALRITHNGQPATNVLVYFQNADNSLVARVTTDATGIAEAVMDQPGGYVTAINPFTTPVRATGVLGRVIPDELRTFAGVKPGDRLVLTHDDDPSSFNVPVIVPDDPGATSYEVATSCGTGSANPPPPPAIRAAAGTGSVELAGCSQTDFLVIAHRNNDGDRIVSAFYHPNVDVAADTEVDFTVDPADTYSDLADVRFHYTNVPDDLETIDATHYLVSPHGVLDASFPATISTTQNAGERAGESLEPAVQDVIGVFDTLAFRSADHHVLIWAANATEYELDMTDVLLPDIESFSSAYDVDAHKITWTEGTAVALPDVTTVELDVERPLPDESILRWHWRIAAPYTAEEVTFPTLPVDTWTPGTDDNTFTSSLLSAKVPGGYDVARAHILDVQDRGDATSFVTGPTGRVVTVGEVRGELKRGGLAPSQHKRGPGRSRAAGTLTRAPAGSPAAVKATRAPATSRATAKATRAPATSRMLSPGHLPPAAR